VAAAIMGWSNASPPPGGLLSISSTTRPTRVGGYGDKMGLLLVLQSRPARPSRMNGSCEHQTGLGNPCVWCPLVFVTKPSLCNKLASIFLLDYPFYVMRSYVGLSELLDLIIVNELPPI
jgi:hypothetical protein